MQLILSFVGQKAVKSLGVACVMGNYLALSAPLIGRPLWSTLTLLMTFPLTVERPLCRVIAAISPPIAR
jgi:hypothetical protein